MLRSEIEGELERALLRPLRDFTEGKGELQPDAQKILGEVGDQMASALTAMATAAETVAAAEKALASRRGAAA